MADSIRVTAPYVTLRMRDGVTDGPVVRGFYANAVVPLEYIDPENLQHHRELEMVEDVVEAPEPEPAKPAKSAAKSAG